MDLIGLYGGVDVSHAFRRGGGVVVVWAASDVEVVLWWCGHLQTWRWCRVGVDASDTFSRRRSVASSQHAFVVVDVVSPIRTAGE